MAATPKRRRTWSNRRPLVIGMFALVLMTGLIAGWSLRANIAGAVIGTGTIELAHTMTAVQHPVGGVVEEIVATDGDLVKAGDVVVRLEDKQLRSDLAVTEDTLFEVLANIARLEATIDGRNDLDMHPLLVKAVAERPQIETLVRRQRNQLVAHFESLATETRLLDEQVAQVQAQIEGLNAQVTAREREMEVVLGEIERLEGLADRGLLRQAELFNQQKAQTIVLSEIARLDAKVAELRAKISELELKSHTIGPKMHQLAVTELSKLRPDRTKYLERRASLLEKLSRLEIRAPISGYIHDSRVLGLRSVVLAGKPLMMIVPDEGPTFVSVKIRDTDIDQVHPGQKASLRFRAFDGRHIPLILGEVRDVSANVFVDSTTRRTYYRVTLTLSDEEVAKLGDRDLLQGMPVDAFLSTETRSPVDYVLRPIMTYFDRAFRDA